MNKAIFLDRDGTLNPDPGYISDPDNFVLFDGVAESLKKLSEAGYLLILITNQSGIARGLISIEQLDAVHNKLKLILDEHGVKLTAIYYCPHHPDFISPDNISNCNCRKPNPGMILKASKDWNIDIANSFMVGDKASDVKIALNTGAQPVFIGKNLPDNLADTPHFDTFNKATNWILNSIKR